MLTFKQSMELAGRCCLTHLDSDKDYMLTGGYEVAHDTGRWWDAMLRLEAATGFVIPAELEAAMLRNLHTLTDNADDLLMNHPDIPWLPTCINPHNFREGMLAFNALVRYRGSGWARRAGHRLLETMDRCYRPDGRFDYSKLVCAGKVPLSDDPSHDQSRSPWFDGTGTSGRSLEAIVWFYEATGDPLALRVAERIAVHHLDHSVNPDGSVRREIIDPQNVGHNHSYLGTLRGLLLYGLLTRRHEYVDAVEATYRNSVWQHNVTESGWSPHDLGKSRFPNEDGDPVAEPASCGDVLQIALWLATRSGQTELWDDVERLMRSRILPAQITSADVQAPCNHGTEITPKMLGGWGSSGNPYGKGCIFDILAAVLHTETDVYQNVLTHTPLGLAVNLHFDYVAPEAQIVVERSRCATVTCRPWVRDNTLLRVPGWAPEESIRLTVDGRDYPLKRIGSYLHVAKDEFSPGSEIVLRYAMPERTTREVMRSGKEYRLHWKGDEVVGISPREAPLCIHPPSTEEAPMPDPG